MSRVYDNAVDPAETKSGSSSLIAEQTEHQYVSEAYLVRVAIIAQGVLFLKLGRSGQQRLLELVSRHCALFLALRERERLQCFRQPASLITDLFSLLLPFFVPRSWWKCPREGRVPGIAQQHAAVVPVAMSMSKPKSPLSQSHRDVQDFLWAL